ncbi:HXXEE domain-containing protein [Paenibacillus sp. BR2-3]|uniref:HXXEE domain-containing protein n=1 Tax=Paenibacillus sp. BR2-3 TaxID=3048494 RepID=UPI003977604F
MISDTSILWLLPIIFMIHDFEEIVPITGWMSKNKEYISKRVPARFLGRVDRLSSLTTSQFSAAVGVLFIIFSISTFLAYEFQFYPLYIVLSLGLFLHAFMHIGASIYLRRWTPGAATSLVLLIPYGLLSIDYFIRNDLLHFPSLLIYIVLVAVLFAPLLMFLHFIGRKLSRPESR